MVYDPSGLDNINFKQSPISRSKYLTRLLVEDSTDGLTFAEQWKTRFEMGLLKVYIDQMETPFLSTIVNLGEMIEVDQFLKPPIGDHTGKAHISIAASTTNAFGR